MSMIRVPSLQPGERSLPAELRTYRGGNFGQRRLNMNLMPSAQGMRGLGDTCTGYDEDGNCIEWTSDTPFPVQTTPVTTIPGVSNPGGGGLTTPAIINTPASYFESLGVDSTTAVAAAPYAQAPSTYTGPKVVAPTATVPAAPTGYQWAQLMNASGQNIAKVLTIAQGGSAVTLANGSQLLYGSPQAAASAGNVLGALTSATGLTSSTVLLLGGAVVLFMLMGNKR